MTLVNVPVIFLITTASNATKKKHTKNLRISSVLMLVITDPFSWHILNHFVIAVISDQFDITVSFQINS